MDFTAQYLPYEQTGYFSKIILDYLKADEKLQPFYTHAVSPDGIKAAIEARKKYPTDRKLLTEVLKKQYVAENITARQQLNIKQLSNENCFTITTAHQPNIFTGHLYFVYKILHTIKLAADLKKELPENNFVPVFYMGSEDADLDELGHIYLFGQKYEWKTNQTGAVGRMKVDKPLVKLIETISGQLTIYPFGKETVALMKDCYKEGTTIERATFQLINALFAEYGLIVLLPDNAVLKNAFAPVIEKELKEQFSHKAVEETAAAFPAAYKLQASGRELNLFYLKDDSRERIEKNNSKFKIINSKIEFEENEILSELQNSPERFSPNVILRPVFQEMILPNIVFIGGGGEIAYWLELKKVFEAVDVPFPVMVLRNSFLIIEKNHRELLAKLNFTPADLFKPEEELMNELVKRDSTVQLTLENEKQSLVNFYQFLQKTSGAVDVSLIKHTQNLQVNTLKKIEALEKKMLKAAKRKFEAQQRQLHKLKMQLFANNSLQERVENIMPYYAKWGNGFIKMLHENSLGLQEGFGILEEQ